MARKQEMDREEKQKVSEILSVPLTPRMMAEVHQIAEHADRKPGQMGRILIREAISARKAGK